MRRLACDLRLLNLLGTIEAEVFVAFSAITCKTWLISGDVGVAIGTAEDEFLELLCRYASKLGQLLSLPAVKIMCVEAYSVT